MARLQAIICGATISWSLADGRRDPDFQPRHAEQASRAVFADRAREFPRFFPNGIYPPNTLVMVDRLVGEPYLLEVQTVAAL